jgi:nucleoid-associated protein YgaU
MTVSDRFYGTSLLYSALATHNQQLGIGWRPTEGVVIEVPTAEYLRTHYGGSERPLVAQNSGVRYIVQEGDTVFRLATDKLQDSTRWREIYTMNSERLQDVRDLKPGMEILLPSKRL